MKQSDTSKIAAEKSRQIIKNSLKAFVETYLEKEAPEVLKDIIKEFRVCDWLNEVELDQEYVFLLNLKLSEEIVGSVYISDSHTPAQIKHLLSIEKYYNQERIDAFFAICIDEDFDYDIICNSDELFNQIKTEIEWLSEGNFEITEAISTNNRMEISLCFKNKYIKIFQVYYPEKDYFLKALKGFSTELCKNDFKNNSELDLLIGNSLLQDFHVKEQSLFNDKSAIEHIILPKGMKVIPTSFFFRCKNLMSVVLPESIEIIENQAFLDCNNLRKINLPKNIKKIGYMAFAYCNSLSNLQVPETCEVDKYAFLSGDDYDPDQDPYYPYETISIYEDEDYINSYQNPDNWY